MHVVFLQLLGNNYPKCKYNLLNNSIVHTHNAFNNTKKQVSPYLFKYFLVNNPLFKLTIVKLQAN